MALATFNSARSIEYLNKYLAYYLQKTDLVFEQIEAMAALNWLDQLNGTKLAEEHKEQWTRYLAERFITDLNFGFESFNLQMQGIKEIRE